MKVEILKGQHYRLRNGEKIGPIHLTDDPEFPFEGAVKDGTIFQLTLDGRYHADGDDSQYDVVAPWSPPKGKGGMPAFLNNANQQGPSSPYPAQPPPVPSHTTPWGNFAASGYQSLARVLQDAHDQAAIGKGRERHASASPFEHQKIMRNGRTFGAGFPLGQGAKKTEEAMGMLNRGQRDEAVAELLGAIVYLSAAVLLIQEA